MDAALLAVECIGIFLVLKWVAKGKGEAGLLGWKPVVPPPAGTGPKRRMRF